MKVAFVHEWMLQYAGSERVVAAMAERFPDAPIYALVHNPDAFRDTPLGDRRVMTSFIQHLPGATRKHQRYLPLMPLAIEQLDMRSYDVVISSSHAVAKGVLTRADQLHVSYVHTPMRYAWDLYHDYLSRSRLDRGLRGSVAKLILHYLRLWDAMSANRVDAFWANSHYVGRRLWKTYRRESKVLYPPVDVARFRCDRPRDDFYLTVSRLVPYKRVDLIVEAFTKTGRPLIVLGDGPERERIERMAGPNVQLLGDATDAVVADHMQRCRAFVFAADEDFGITPVEAQAAGAPVIAWGHGGVLETVVEGQTGTFYPYQHISALNAAVAKFEAGQFDFQPDAIREQAERFNPQRFRARFDRLLDELLTTEQPERAAV